MTKLVTLESLVAKSCYVRKKYYGKFCRRLKLRAEIVTAFGFANFAFGNFFCQDKS